MNEGGGTNLFEALRRGLLLIIVTTLCASLAVTAVALSRPEEYNATAQILFAPPGPELSILGTYIPGPNNAEFEAATNIVRVQSRSVAIAAADALGTLNANEVRRRVQVANQQDSNVVNVTAKGATAENAARLANAYATAFIDLQRRNDARRAKAARTILESRFRRLPASERTGERAETLRDRIEQLETLETIGTGSPSLIQRAEEQATSVDNRSGLIGFGVVLGLLLGCSLALIRDRLDRRLRDDDQLAGDLDVPVLASVARSKAIRRNTPFADLPEVDAEGFRFLHARLRFSRRDAPLGMIIVTSARGGEGKTTVSSNLASAAAASGSRVLLLEADLRRPVLAARLGIDHPIGLMDMVLGEAHLEDAVVELPVHHEGLAAREGRTLDVVHAGSSSHEAAVLMQSEAMQEVLRDLREAYDLVVIDTPPLGMVADSLPLLSQVDGVIIAAFLGYSGRRDTSRLAEQVRETGTPVLGVVISNSEAAAGYDYAATPADLRYAPEETGYEEEPLEDYAPEPVRTGNGRGRGVRGGSRPRT